MNEEIYNDMYGLSYNRSYNRKGDWKMNLVEYRNN